MDVKRSVSSVNQDLTTRTIIFVSLLHGSCVPVCPVNCVLEHSQGKRVRQSPIIHCVSVLTIQIGVSEMKIEKFQVSLRLFEGIAITSW